MDQLIQDVRFGLRMLGKTPAFTAVAVFVLALGIGANSAMFTLVDALLFRPLAGRADELVGLYSHDRTKPDSYRDFSYQNFADIRATSDVFDGLMAHTFAMVGIQTGDVTRQTFAEVVSSNYFDTLGVPVVAGRTFTRGEEAPGAHIPVVIVGSGRHALVGDRLRINAIDFTVVGIAPAGTGTMALVAPDMWFPLGVFDLVVNDIFKNKGGGLSERGGGGLVVAGRLKPGVTMAAASAQLESISRGLASAYPAENHDQLLTISPLPRLSTSTSPQTDKGLGAAAAGLMGLASVVLLIASLNIANMLLARGASRRKEIAIRLAVGGARGRIVRQLLTEGLLLALAGAAGGLLLAYWTTGALVKSFASVLPLAVQFDPRPNLSVIAATTAFAVAATMLFALGPALKTTRANLVLDLKEATSDAQPGILGRRFTARNVLVVGQIALSLMLLSAGGLFARGALKAAVTDPGFRYDRELLVAVDPALAQYDEVRGRSSVRAALTRVRGLPGVEAASQASSVPFGDIHEGNPVERLGSPGQPPASAVYRIVGADYFRALGLRMMRGREFSAAEEESSSAPRAAIVDEHLARRLFGEDDPIGQMVRFAPRSGDSRAVDTEPLEVVGIAPPIRDELFDREPGPAIYVPAGRNYRSGTNIHVRLLPSVGGTDVLAAIRRALTESDPRLSILQSTTMQAFHDRSLQLWMVRAGGRVFLLLGLLALTLAVVGLYGVKSYLIAQRTREIGIRMALGARPQDVLGMIMREGAALSAVGVGLGLPLAAVLGVALSSVLYDVTPLDPIVFTTAPSALALAALLATWLPARRATHVTPLTALRE
jgi:predicted permease